MIGRVVAGLVLCVVAVCVSLVVGELVARVVLGLDGEGVLAERADFAARLPATTFESKSEGTRRIVQMAYGARFELHPFFGYTSARGQDHANRAGFTASGREYPYRAEPGEFVVGVFGGSVAMQVANAGTIIQDALQPVVEAKGYRRVTILSFALGAWRQPQSFYAFVRYLHTIDLAIVVDGFNEINLLNPHLMQRWPAEFPTAEVFFQLTQNSSYVTPERARAIIVNQVIASATSTLDESGLGRSVLAHLVWRLLAARSPSPVEEAKEEAYVQPADPTAFGTDGAARVTEYYAYWADLIRNMDLLGSARGIPVFHFIQPNQYDRGSKPLSEEELEEFTRANNFDRVTREYARVEKMVGGLAAEGIESHFLGDIFIDEEQTVYSDSCCHFNDEGVALLTGGLMEHVLVADRLDMIPEVRN